MQAGSSHAMMLRVADDADAVTGFDRLALADGGRDRLVCRAQLTVNDGNDTTPGEHPRVADSAWACCEDGLARVGRKVNAAMTASPWGGGRREIVQDSVFVG